MLGFLPTRAYRPGTPGATTFLSPLSGTFNYGWDSFPDCFWGDTTSAPNPEVAIDLAGSPAIIDNLLVGSAIRAFHPVQFGLEEVSGRYWLVQRVPSVIGPERLAGPLMSPADSGLVFSYYDADGDATTTPSDVATVEILLKAESREDLSAYVRSGTLADTLRLRVSVRNN